MYNNEQNKRPVTIMVCIFLLADIVQVAIMQLLFFITWIGTWMMEDGPPPAGTLTVPPDTRMPSACLTDA